ncbi:(p)ppGpp synthetase I, SpoT/RelA [Desulfotomaculum nigrificans CO-1-SRB]|uniref:GTP diphosphokinase n=1 Tax=Desulfotomaculum nigrificans (strain DSM 14880 / VKM B-2319 / CO-1-SRB) TaxID=868595 RepID=F6B2Z6_DESCC|nr:bifunctional (p)ppGpp synthetase/guanosine-3',5'-bis(diphosphate) 3'-pyrophosphohydrolase [Desulfotomaculum nigrificans]AEF95104.1 (p)ppGpp synthetase I, SpoT/RelA [Desulfotomaculum nigrificans CO-1-SRB]
MSSLFELEQKILLYNPSADIAFLRKAYNFAENAHRGQKRISGEDYIVHPLAIAIILAELQLDIKTVAAGLLHDVVEDTGVTLADIENNFGSEVARMVDGVTKLGKLQFQSREERQAENLRKMFLAMAKDIRVILIKLADRLHNLRTLQFQSERKQKEVAEETLVFFAPLAHRLGIYKIKWELEDLSFRYKEPEQYQHLKMQIAKTRAKREEYIQEVIRLLAEKLNAVNIRAEIQGRPKNLYSIYQKMVEQQKELKDIFDVQAVRVLVDTVKDCYGALGIAHTLWKPIPGRFKDYIAMPKSNMYQSLHTTVIGPNGEPVEIQIRTWDMHRVAEYGIAAHWKYKEGKQGDQDLDKKLAWLRQMMDFQHDARDAREFMENLKIDLFSQSVFVFTPKGDVMELPAGATPLDFAYRIHTDVGHRTVGAKVNGRIVPLDYKLKNGNIIEIITSKASSGPSRDWLNIVKTSQAKNRIRQWFKKERREENIARGRDALEREARKQGLELEVVRGEKLQEYAKRIAQPSVDDLYAAIGDGQILPSQVVAKLREEYRSEREQRPLAEEMMKKAEGKASEWGKPTQGIKVKGIDNLLIRLAHCCNPVPGDPIVGYITRGRGVSIHRADCANIAPIKTEEPERVVEVAWDKDFQSPFQVKLEVTGMDRPGFLNDVLNVLMDLKINASWVNARTRKDQIATVGLAMQVRNTEQLEYLINKINKVKDVYGVRRVSTG